MHKFMKLELLIVYFPGRIVAAPAKSFLGHTAHHILIRPDFYSMTNIFHSLQHTVIAVYITIQWGKRMLAVLSSIIVSKLQNKCTTPVVNTGTDTYAR